MFPNNSKEIRIFLKNIWAKANAGETLEGAEAQLFNIMQMHPEYHPLFESDTFIEQEFKKENPVMHLFMHQALVEQISTNRPQGIVDVYAALIKKYGDVHKAEHSMMECLTYEFFQVMKEKTGFNEVRYIEKLRGLMCFERTVSSQPPSRDLVVI